MAAKRTSDRQVAIGCLTVAALLYLMIPASWSSEPTPDDQSRPDASVGKFPMQDGKSLYEAACQGCHMPNGEGAVGAGVYPPLAKNGRPVAASYCAVIIIHGQKAMPAMGQYFDDQQIAELVNYIRMQFGGQDTDKMTAAEVKALR